MTRNCSHYLQVKGKKYTFMLKIMEVSLHRRPRAHDVLPLCKLQAGLKLLNISLAASFLVVLAGDVSLNPGPETDQCALCAKGCRKNQRAVQCDECDRWFRATKNA